MNRALFAAASGMAAQQITLDVVANNLANADVAGFKGSFATFAAAGAPGSTSGTLALGTSVRFEQGKLQQSGGAFDVAIDGAGFFRVRNGGARAYYTRDGSFARAANGELHNAQGYRLEGVRIPADALGVRVGPDGTVSATTARGEKPCGRITVYAFPAPERLASAGGTLFRDTAESGRARAVSAGGDTGTAIRFGMLEQSNVSIVESMMQILEAQRAYEANAKGVQAADEMLRIADNLQRG